MEKRLTKKHENGYTVADEIEKDPIKIKELVQKLGKLEDVMEETGLNINGIRNISELGHVIPLKDCKENKDIANAYVGRGSNLDEYVNITISVSKNLEPIIKIEGSTDCIIFNWRELSIQALAKLYLNKKSEDKNHETEIRKSFN